MSNLEREPTMVLSEAVGMLSFAALRALYEEQPALWQMGERGRARTLEDFAHHFESLATLDPDAFASFLADQRDLGTKWAPRYVRIVDALPVGATNSIADQTSRHTRQAAYRFVPTR